MTWYQFWACLRAVRSFIPWRVRRFIRYSLYVLCLLVGFSIGVLYARGGLSL